MNAYEHVFEIVRYHLETVERQSIKALKEGSLYYQEINKEQEKILALPWFDDFLSEKLSSPIMEDQAKTILRYIYLESLNENELKIMYYLNGLQDASMFYNILK